ncbi:MAG: hypothetical protein ACYTFW_12290, partial [Planctomycetota bacterium]
GYGLQRLAIECHGDFFSRGCRSKDGSGQLALQDHVVGKQVGQLDFGHGHGYACHGTRYDKSGFHSDVSFTESFPGVLYRHRVLGYRIRHNHATFFGELQALARVYHTSYLVRKSHRLCFRRTVAQGLRAPHALTCRLTLLS